MVSLVLLIIGFLIGAGGSFHAGHGGCNRYQRISAVAPVTHAAVRANTRSGHINRVGVQALL
jgi:hypothetical protein